MEEQDKRVFQYAERRLKTSESPKGLLVITGGELQIRLDGAGGEGGSVTLLCGPTSSVEREMIRQIEAANPLYKNIPIYLSRFGLRIWDV